MLWIGPVHTLFCPRWVLTITTLPVHRATSAPSLTVTVPKPRHPLDPRSLSAPVQYWKISPPITTLLPSSLPSLPLPLPLPQNQPLPVFILRAPTPFLTLQPPSSPCSYPTALPSRSIPRAVHTEAYCVGWETAGGCIQSEHQRKGMCRAELGSVFLLYFDTDL